MPPRPRSVATYTTAPRPPATISRPIAGHPDSPLDEPVRASFRGLPLAPYDGALRFETEVLPAAAHRLEVPTASDGVVPFERIGVGPSRSLAPGGARPA